MSQVFSAYSCKIVRTGVIVGSDHTPFCQNHCKTFVFLFLFSLCGSVANLVWVIIYSLLEKKIYREKVCSCKYFEIFHVCFKYLFWIFMVDSDFYLFWSAHEVCCKKSLEFFEYLNWSDKPFEMKGSSMNLQMHRGISLQLIPQIIQMFIQ